MIFAMERSFAHLGRESSDSVKFGGGIMSKSYGAVIQRFNIKDTSICLINCHLSSGKDSVSQRLSEIEKIYKDAFQKDKFGQVQEETIDSSDITFLFGNLNFRLSLPDNTSRLTCDGMDTRFDSHWTDEEIRKIRELSDTDEFVNCPAQNDILNSFVEGPLCFGPTYKFDTKSKRFAVDNGFTCAWTDRILYSSEEGGSRCIKYGSVPSVRESTHM